MIKFEIWAFNFRNFDWTYIYMYTMLVDRLHDCIYSLRLGMVMVIVLERFQGFTIVTIVIFMIATRVTFVCDFDTVEDFINDQPKSERVPEAMKEQ